MGNPDIDSKAVVLAAEKLPQPAQLPVWSPAQSDHSEPDVSLGFYLTFIKRYRWRIITFVLLVTTLGTLISLVLPRQYESTAILRIDPSSASTVGQSNNGSNSIPMSARRLITTESDVVVSPAVVLKTIRQLNLYRDPQFSSKALVRPGSTPTPQQMNLVLRKVTAAISVDQPLDSYLLRVGFRSNDPSVSAAVANSLLQSLIAHDYQTRVQALLGSSVSMRSQLTDLRAKMERSQEALVHYESSHDVLNPDSKNNIMLARLSQVNQDLGRAQTRRMALQADYQVVKTGNLDALIATDRSQYLLPLYQRLLQDQRQLSRMAQVYGPNYPVYLQQQALVSHDRHVLTRQEIHVARQIRSQYQMALAREKLLRGELALQKKRMDAFNLKAIRYYALKAASDSYTRLFYQLQQRIQDAAVAANLHSETLRIISPARPIDRPVFPHPLLTAALCFLLSAMLGVGAAIAIGVMDKSITNPEQVEQAFGLPVLASLPMVEFRNHANLNPMGYGPTLLGSVGVPEKTGDESSQHSSAFREGILSLHSAVRLARENELQCLAVTSSLPSEGKSTIVANLAGAFAGLGSKTILVDADMRKPSMHRQFGIQNHRGLSSVLRGQCTLDQALNEAHGITNLYLLTAGHVPASPAELLHLGLNDLIEHLRARFDFILFDCAPSLGFADTLAIANQVDGCLLVVRAGQTDRQMVSASLRQLRSVRANIMGIVLNSVSRELGSYYSYYSHYYKYQNQAGDQAAPEE